MGSSLRDGKFGIGQAVMAISMWRVNPTWAGPTAAIGTESVSYTHLMVPEIFAAGGIECVDGCRFVPKHIGEQFRREDLFDAFRVREDFPIV